MQPRLLKHPARLAGASLLRLQDDNRLVALAREGHDPAFAAIVDRYRPQLERYCARLLNDTHPARSEDAVQQAFVNAHTAMKTTDQELVLKPWLYRIAHNAALNILRASKGEETALDLEHAGAVQTADVVLLREQLRETLASIQALPPAQRDALLLREIEGRSHEEIALALGVTAGGARQHLHRARMSLRAAASAITPYPILSRILSAAADEGGRSADLVSGAGMGLGAGGVKAATAVLAAGALAGGAVGVHHHHRAGARSPAAEAQRATTVTHAAAAAAVTRTTAPAANPAAPHHASSSHSSPAPARVLFVSNRHRGPSSEIHRSGSSDDDGAEHEVEHHDGSGSTPTKTTDDHSGPGGGSDDNVTTTATTTDDNSGPGSTSSGSDDGLTSGSGSDDGMTQTTTSTTDDRSGSGRDGGSGGLTSTTDGH